MISMTENCLEGRLDKLRSLNRFRDVRIGVLYINKTLQIYYHNHHSWTIFFYTANIPAEPAINTKMLQHPYKHNYLHRYKQTSNIKLILKGKRYTMRHNCSLRDLKVTNTRFQNKNYHVYPINFISIQNTPTSTLNLDNIEQPIQDKNTIHPFAETDRFQRSISHKNLNVPVLRFQLVSPKEKYQTCVQIDQPDKEKQQKEQYILTNSKNYKVSPIISTLNVLRPVDKNICQVEEPKKHKILQPRQKQLSFSQDFFVGKKIGKGRFGNVYTVMHKTSKFIMAAKQISLEKVSKKLIERLIWEIKIQSFLKHENCLQIYKYFRQGDNIYLLLQLGDQSLFDKLREKRYFTEAQTCYYLTQTIKALLHMHKHGIIHRDLKPQNIVLVNNVVKLGDFGWSIFVSNNSKRNTFCGTLDYVSPQIVLGNQYDQMVDVWSVGVLCYELCTGHAPFASKIGREQTYRKILNVDLKFPKYLSDDIKDFISRLLARDPRKRMNLQEAMKHKWIVKYCPK